LDQHIPVLIREVSQAQPLATAGETGPETGGPTRTGPDGH